MKIDSQDTAVANVATSKKVSTKEQNKTTQDAKVNTQRPDRDALQQQMVRWFAQVGISSKGLPTTAQGLDDAIRLRQQMAERRKMTNLQRICELSLDYCLDKGSPDNLDADWFFNFASMAETIHSPAMQQVWAKIFAFECGRPGSFSIRTLQILSQLTHKEAKLLSAAVSLASWRKDKDPLSPRLLLGYRQPPGLFAIFGGHRHHQLNLAQFGLTYPNLLTLSERGLLFSSEIESAQFSAGEQSQWRCGDDTLALTAKRNGVVLTYLKFTTTGAELARLISAEHHDNYLGSLRNLLASAFDIS